MAALGLLEGGDLREVDVDDRGEGHARLRAGAIDRAAAAVAERAGQLDGREGMRRAHHQQRAKEAPLDLGELVHVAHAHETRGQPTILAW